MSDDPAPAKVEAQTVVLGCGLFPVESGQYGRRHDLPAADKAFIGVKLEKTLEIIRGGDQ